MNGFERRKQQKTISILEGALTLFMKFGIKKVSIAEIARKANVSQVTIYNYFGSKNELTDEVIRFYIEKTWDETEELLTSDLPFPDKIQQLIFSKKQTADEMNENFYQEFMMEYGTGNNYLEEFYTNKALPKMMELFDEGKRQGYVDPSISNESILLYIQIFKEQMQREDIYSQLLPLTEEITKLFFYGILGKRN
ncbi:TetR/AcrR family transcriptional regulator [Virgibacillus necropolis]|uniref:TetR family transcriptional regulator n=1 Tax=Virgibacillus necropolis TaxID=163877 RepID=A0A221MHQ5_9BACI|nr:TetR/AcrR family transcriptional regulator [Virgibacillus necropolis]ASN07142.1 TetR family transcriptional regulator [Virgibacillus necropolis]